MSTWLIGESPTSYSTEAFTGQAGDRLCQMSGFDVKVAFRCTNVLKRHPGRSKSKGARFPLEEAKREAMKFLLSDELQPEDRLILVGGRVAKKAFRLKKWVEPYQWTTLIDGTDLLISRPILQMPVAYIPHPSGINQHWNDTSNVQRLRDFMQSVCGHR